MAEQAAWEATFHPTIMSTDTKDSSRYVTDILACKPIFMKTTDAICSIDDSDMDDVISNSGYSLTVDDLQAAAQAKQSGSGFDIRMCGGLYEFIEPTDMKSHQFIVNPSNAKIYIDGSPVNNKTDDNGSVTWTYGGYNYTVTFDVGYDVTGDIKPHSFSGKRVVNEPNETEVSGKQIIPSSSVLQDLVANPWVQSVAIVATLTGVSCLSIYQSVWKKIQGVNWTGDVVIEGRAKARSYLSDAEDKFVAEVDYSNMQAEVEVDINRAVNEYITINKLDPSDLTSNQLKEIRQVASANATNTFEARVTAEVGGECDRRYTALAKYAHNPESVQLITESSAKRSFKDREKGLDRKAEYLKARVDIAVRKAVALQATESAKKYTEAADECKQEAANLREQKAEKEKEKKEREQELREEGYTEEQIKNDSDVQSLEEEIESLKEQAEEQDKEAADNTKEADKETKTASAQTEKEKQDQDKADENSGKIFGEGK